MSSNRFTHLQSRNYLSGYVPLPLDMMYQGLANKQKQFDANTDDIKATQELIKINADPNREGIRNQLLTKYNNEINSLTDEFLKTGDSSVMSKVNKLKRDFANDETRLNLESSYAAYGEYKKKKQEAVDKSEYNDWKDYDPYKYDQVYDKEGNVMPFRFEGLYKKQNYDKNAQALMNDLKADGYDNLIENTSFKDGLFVKVGSKGEYVNDPKVHTVAKSLVQNLINGEGGSYFVDQVINEATKGKSGHVNYAELPKEYKDYVDAKAFAYLKNTGEKEKFGKYGKTQDLTEMSEGFMGNMNPDKTVGTTWAPANTTDNNIQVAGVGISDIVTNDPTTGQAKIDWIKLVENRNEYVPLMGHASYQEIQEMNKNPAKFKEEFAKEAAKIAKANGLGSIEETILFLQRANVSANSVLMPTDETSVNITNKMVNQFDKDQMKGAEQKSFNEVKESGEYKDKDINFQGIDFSDKNRPRVKFQFSKEGGKSEYQSFTIPNNTYNEALKPLNELVNSTHEKLVDPSKRNPTQVGTAVASLGHAVSLQPEILRVLGVNKFNDLNALGASKVGNKEVYTFSDNKGNISSLVWDNETQSYNAYPSLTNVVDDEFGRIINSSELRENLDKTKKQTEYR